VIFNNDGYDDLSISSIPIDTSLQLSGKVQIFFGSNDFIDESKTIELNSNQASEGFGFANTIDTDFNNNGTKEIIIGVPYFDSPVYNAGAVYSYEFYPRYTFNFTN
jgi:hypothetical protein